MYPGWKSPGEQGVCIIVAGVKVEPQKILPLHPPDFQYVYAMTTLFQEESIALSACRVTSLPSTTMWHAYSNEIGNIGCFLYF